jgi:hypothetical protein
MTLQRPVFYAAALFLTAALAGCGGGQATVGGHVTGLTSGLSVVLQNNGKDELTVTGSSASSVPFTFVSEVAASNAYSVSVFSQPPGSNCVVSNGSGSISATALDVTNVAVTCTVSSTVVVVVSGVSANASVTLSSSGSTMAVGNGSVAFPALLSAGSTYSVAITKQPTGQICSLANASGTVVANQSAVVRVTCS